MHDRSSVDQSVDQFVARLELSRGNLALAAPQMLLAANFFRRIFFQINQEIDAAPARRPDDVGPSLGRATGPQDRRPGPIPTQSTFLAVFLAVLKGRHERTSPAQFSCGLMSPEPRWRCQSWVSTAIL